MLTLINLLHFTLGFTFRWDKFLVEWRSSLVAIQDCRFRHLKKGHFVPHIQTRQLASDRNEKWKHFDVQNGIFHYERWEIISLTENSTAKCLFFFSILLFWHFETRQFVSNTQNGHFALAKKGKLLASSEKGQFITHQKKCFTNQKIEFAFSGWDLPGQQRSSQGGLLKLNQGR